MSISSKKSQGYMFCQGDINFPGLHIEINVTFVSWLSLANIYYDV